MKIGGSKWYWRLQLLGWGVYLVAGIMISKLYPIYDFNKAVIFQFFSFALLLATSHFIRHYLISRQWLKMSWKQLIPRILLLNLVSSIWVNVINSLIMVYVLNMFENVTYSFAALSMYVVQLFVFFSLWSAVYLAVHFFRTYKMAEIEKWKLEATVKDAELIALKSQINPHFIFNSLNNIRSLIVEDPEKARNMITHLSTLLRYSIQFNNQELVKLDDEMKIVQDYLNLESIQLEDRLKYHFSIPEETRSVMIPPMTVQLLVENAIKHGINLLPEGGEIEIRATKHSDQLRLEVINTGQLNDEKRGTGIGLKNASERLSLFFGKLTDLTIRNLNNHQVAASFSVPIADN